MNKKSDIIKHFGKAKKELEQTEIPFKTPYNADNFPKEAEENDEPSMTIPDESMSVREIMNRYAKGLPLMGQRVPMYDSENEIDLPDLTGKDLAEIQEIREQVQQEIYSIKDKAAQEAREKQKAAYEAKIEAEIKKRQEKPKSEDPK